MKFHFLLNLVKKWLKYKGNSSEKLELINIIHFIFVRYVFNLMKTVYLLPAQNVYFMV